MFEPKICATQCAMISVKVRKQGGAAVITIPSAITRILNFGVGADLELQIQGDSLLVKPLSQGGQKRFTLAQLLQGATAESIRALSRETLSGTGDSDIGHEL